MRIDEAMGETAATLLGVEVEFSPGSPQSPLSPERHAAKIRNLAGLEQLPADARPAEELLEALS